MKEEFETTRLISDDNSDIEIDLFDLLHYLKSKLLILIAVLLVGACIAFAITYFLITPTYKAISYVYIDQSDINNNTSVATDYEQLLTRRPILENVANVIDDIVVSETAKTQEGKMVVEDISSLANCITLSTLQDSHVFSISVVTPYPEISKDIANVLADQATSYIPKSLNVTTSTVAEYAVVPKHKYAPSYRKNVALGGLLCLIFACTIYVVLYLRDDSIKTSEDVEKYFGIVPLTVIPEGKIADAASHSNRSRKGRKKKA